MDKIRIRGGRPLSGNIVIGGAKNAALPLMAAGLLTGERLVLTNVPMLADIQTMAQLLRNHGVAVEPEGDDGRVLSIDGPMPGSNDSKYYRYDAYGRKTWEIGGLGPNGLRVATRTSYRDSDGKVVAVDEA